VAQSAVIPRNRHERRFPLPFTSDARIISMHCDRNAYFSQQPFLSFFMVDSGFADRLALAMRDKRITQAALASGLEVSQSTVSRWLGGAMPRKLVLVGISNFLNVRLDWLRDGKGNPGFFSPVTLITDVVSFKDLPDNPSERELRKFAEPAFEAQRRGFGVRVHLLRKRCDFGLKEFAARCGMTPSYLSRIESGSRTNPSVSTIDKLMTAFPVMKFWLTHGDPPILVPQEYRRASDERIVRILTEMEKEELVRRREYRQDQIQKMARNQDFSTPALVRMIESQKEASLTDSKARAARDLFTDILTARLAIEAESKANNKR
jgi:transcriptional regulator with XRE-family HTH domain